MRRGRIPREIFELGWTRVGIGPGVEAMRHEIAGGLGTRRVWTGRRVMAMGVRFPQVEGSSLSGTPHHLPGTLAGDINLLLIAFRQWQQSDVTTWLPVADALSVELPGFRAYELPVISQVYGPVSGFIDGGMRGGIPDPEVREATITLYINRKRFLADLHIRSVDAIVPMLVTPSGEILWRTSGRRTDEKESTLREAIERR